VQFIASFQQSSTVVVEAVGKGLWVPSTACFRAISTTGCDRRRRVKDGNVIGIGCRYWSQREQNRNQEKLFSNIFLAFPKRDCYILYNHGGVINN
jgi:hypothetical protein